MLEPLIGWLGQVQGGIVRTLAAELRAGGLGAAGLAFALGALHALTPGHGKAALAAYLLGKETQVGKGLRIALLAALLHVLTGFTLFLLLHFVVGKVVAISGRTSPSLTVLGYVIIIAAGLLMILQSFRSTPTDDHGHTISAGIGLLPCPLTISVLGFAWSQGNAPMIGLVLVALALGIAMTISAVALLAILGRKLLGVVAGPWSPEMDRASRYLQGVGGLAIVMIALWTLWPQLKALPL